jgi:hypothetical protein
VRYHLVLVVVGLVITASALVALALLPRFHDAGVVPGRGVVTIGPPGPCGGVP